MPLFMDYHRFDNITIEAVKTAHIADKGVQDEFGVKYHQFWVNEEEGSVFCLVEGPDAATCEKVHQMAHGNIACALTRVDPGLYTKLMGKDITVDHGLVQRADGRPDGGYRNILVASVYGLTAAKTSKELSEFFVPDWARKIVAEKICECKGREVEWDIDDSQIGAFDDTNNAVLCALEIQANLNVKLKQGANGIIYKIGISASQPVTKTGDFFSESIKLAHRLSTTVQDNQILTSSLVKKLCLDKTLFTSQDQIRSLSQAEEEFISQLLGITEANLSELEFDLDNLSNAICISRPQLYRKVKALTGRSPNDFLQHFRMYKALSLLKQRRLNVAEIAFETGFNSPSYFTKCFTEKFGCKPSLFTRANAT